MFGVSTDHPSRRTRMTDDAVKKIKESLTPYFVDYVNREDFLDEIASILQTIPHKYSNPAFHQSFWEQSIQLPELYTFYEAQRECPDGYRVPNKEEWHWLIDNTKFSFDEGAKDGVFTFPDGFELRLPAAGYKNDLERIFNMPSRDLGYLGNYWSVSKEDCWGYFMSFLDTSAGILTFYMDYLYSVRCVPIEV